MFSKARLNVLFHSCYIKDQHKCLQDTKEKNMEHGTLFKRTWKDLGTTKISVILVFSVNRCILADVILMLLFILVRDVLTSIAVTSNVPWICVGLVLFHMLINDLEYSVNAEITELAADLKLLMVTTSRAGLKNSSNLNAQLHSKNKWNVRN